MLIEEYFEFLAADDIRVKGTRVGIESILYEYIYRQRSPEEIIKHFSTLSLDQIYATILYYLTNKEAVNKYEEKQPISAYEAAKEFAGCVDFGPGDLATNKEYLKLH